MRWRLRLIVDVVQQISAIAQIPHRPAVKIARLRHFSWILGGIEHADNRRTLGRDWVGLLQRSDDGGELVISEIEGGLQGRWLGTNCLEIKDRCTSHKGDEDIPHAMILV